MKLMRDADISTTMDFYVDLDAIDLAAGIWAVYENGNRLATPEPAESAEALCGATGFDAASNPR